ncbi:MAG: GNAT family N-acetyltransferase [Clostridiaceae bacterium]|jgi:GNAT superfamily N-acetyltransferase|nr:GNAT family N-acetyltransferase [Clostridiaceae bacterium]
MKIIKYKNNYKQQIIDLVLHIQNSEAKINLSIDEQPDLLNIPFFYEKNGGEFWIAINNEDVIGTFAFMNYGNGNAVLKKFFVRADWRGKKVGLKLYKTVINFLQENNYKQALLDTPSVAKSSHRFYEKAGFKKITKKELPFSYEYPDRDSYLYLLNL